MKDFFDDNWEFILFIILIIFLLIISVNYINAKNEERLAIINNTKDNVTKFSECEYIDNYYYCFND